MAIVGKRGISQESFHWIFVLAAGAIILLFFIMIIAGVKKSSENKMSISMMESLDSIFVGAQASDDTLNIINAPPQTQMEIVCDADGYSEFSLSGSSVSKQNTNRIIFSQSKITGRQFTVFTRSINLPFKLDNAIYISDPGTKYVVINNPQLITFADDIMNLLPANVTKEKVNSLGDAQTDGIREIVIIASARSAASAGKPTLVHVKAKEAKLITVIPSGNGVADKGQIYFHRSVRVGGALEWEDDSTTGYYVGEALLLGAIFAEDSAFYECGIKKMYRRLYAANALQQRRIEIIKDATASRIGCQPIFEESIDALAKIYANTNVQATSQNLYAIYDPIQELEEINNRAVRMDCPLLY